MSHDETLGPEQAERFARIENVRWFRGVAQKQELADGAITEW